MNKSISKFLLTGLLGLLCTSMSTSSASAFDPVTQHQLHLLQTKADHCVNMYLEGYYNEPSFENYNNAFAALVLRAQVYQIDQNGTVDTCSIRDGYRLLGFRTITSPTILDELPFGGKFRYWSAADCYNRLDRLFPLCP